MTNGTRSRGLISTLTRQYQNAIHIDLSPAGKSRRLFSCNSFLMSYHPLFHVSQKGDCNYFPILTLPIFVLKAL